jgi:large subunit ribosomal protein L6
LHIFIKMKKSFFQEIEIPEGVNVEIKGNEIIVKGSEGESKRELKLGKCKIEKKDKKIRIGNEKATKREKKIANTLSAHIKNMIKGVQEKFEYELKVCSSHFPITVKVEGNKAIIKNFLGEKIERSTDVLEGVDVEVKKDLIFVRSLDKEKAGQTAANLENITKIRGRDIRIFQDGIYIIKKDGKEI